MEHPKSNLCFIVMHTSLKKSQSTRKIKVSSRILCSLPQESEDTVSNRINEQMWRLNCEWLWATVYTSRDLGNIFF